MSSGKGRERADMPVFGGKGTRGGSALHAQSAQAQSIGRTAQRIVYAADTLRAGYAATIARRPAGGGRISPCLHATHSAGMPVANKSLIALKIPQSNYCYKSSLSASSVHPSRSVSM